MIVYVGNIMRAPKIDVFLFALSELITLDNISDNDCSVIPQILDTQAATMDTKAQFCSSHGYATEALVISTQHITLDDRMKSVEGLLTSSSSGFL